MHKALIAVRNTLTGIFFLSFIIYLIISSYKLFMFLNGYEGLCFSSIPKDIFYPGMVVVAFLSGTAGVLTVLVVIYTVLQFFAWLGKKIWEG